MTNRPVTGTLALLVCACTAVTLAAADDSAPQPTRTAAEPPSEKPNVVVEIGDPADALGEQPTDHQPRERERQRAILRTEQTPPALTVLAQWVSEIEFADESFEKVLDWLRSRGKVNVIVLWRTLEVYAVDRDTRVSLALQDVTVQQVLAAVCEQLSPDGGIGFQAYGNTIKIAAQEHFDRILYTRVYELGDVTFDIPDFANDWFEHQRLSAGSRSADFDRHLFKEERLQMFADLIQQTIAPGHWARDGGDYTITIYETSLIVRAPISVHEQIAGPFYLPE